MHPRVNLHQVAFMGESTAAFIAHCRAIGVQHMTLVTPKLMLPGGLEEAQAALAGGGPKATVVNHPFAMFPNLDRDSGQAAAKLLEAIDIAGALGAPWIYRLRRSRVAELG
jgi:sugar phosphate isomerase/epimerase